MKTKFCKECGAPITISHEHIWTSDGRVLQRRNPEHRLIFYETSAIETLFSNLEGLLGVSLEKIIVESKTKATRDYIEGMLKGAKRILTKNNITAKLVLNKVINVGRLFGYGSISLDEFRLNEYARIKVANIYNKNLQIGDMRGTFEAICKIPSSYKYREEGRTSIIEVFADAEASDEQVASRLERRIRPVKQGDIKLNRCSICGLPSGIGLHKWNISEGTIVSSISKIRMSIFGPEGIESIFREIENEIGPEIPASVIEAQKGFIKSDLPSADFINSINELRKHLALRGFGNLTEYEFTDKMLYAVIENPALPMLLIGFMQGAFELTTKADSYHEFKQDAFRLEIRIRPKD